MESTLNNFVDDMLTDLPLLFKNEFNKAGRSGQVPANVKETENSYQLEVVAPGFEKNDFKINLDKELLTISAEKPVAEQSKEQSPVKDIRREYSVSSFKRSFTIDEKIDATKIEASYINGILVLSLPKKEEVIPPVKEITIK